MPRSAKLKAWDIYAKELIDLGYGHPLWIPEPSPESGEVQLGDVGYLSQGKFCFLFNCMRGADDQVNRRGVPEGFEVFIPPDGPVEESAKNIRDHIQNKLLLSNNTRLVEGEARISLGIDPLAHVDFATSYEVKQKTGACLALKRHAHQTSLHCTEAIGQYLRAHHLRWLTFAIERRGRKIDSQHILFVSGFVKTAVWGVGAFRHESSSAALNIDVGAMFGGGPVSASAGGAMSLSNCSAPMSLHRNGPADRLPWNDDTLHSDDQCIFLQYAHLKYRWPIGTLRPLSSSTKTYSFVSLSPVKDDDMRNSSLGAEGTEAHGADNSDFANESYRKKRRLSPYEDHVRLNIRDPVSSHEESSLGLSSQSLPISPTFSQRQYGVHGPSESFVGEVQDVDAASRPCPRDVLDSAVANSEPSGHRVALQEREEAIEVSDGNGSGDEDDSEDDELDEVDEVALDYILAHSDCLCACASTQDLYLFRQARHVRGEAPDRN